jgi:hypothetical protein
MVGINRRAEHLSYVLWIALQGRNDDKMMIRVVVPTAHVSKLYLQEEGVTMTTRVERSLRRNSNGMSCWRAEV